MNENKSVMSEVAEVASDAVEGAVDVIKAGLSGGVAAAQAEVVDNVVGFVGDLLDGGSLAVDASLNDLTTNGLIKMVEGWAEVRNIIRGSFAKDQYLKLVAEFGETALAIAEEKQDKIVDGIGDCLVVIIIVAAQLDISVEECIYMSVLDDRLYEKENKFLRLSSNLGELADAISKKDRRQQELFIGNMVVILANLAHEHDTNIVVCLQAAYDDIKDRKGVMYNGVFVKGNDPRYEEIMAELAGGL